MKNYFCLGCNYEFNKKRKSDGCVKCPRCDTGKDVVHRSHPFSKIKFKKSLGNRGKIK